MNNYEKIKNCESRWELAKFLNNLTSPLIESAVINDEIIDADSWDRVLYQEAQDE